MESLLNLSTKRVGKNAAPKLSASDEALADELSKLASTAIPSTETPYTGSTRFDLDITKTTALKHMQAEYSGDGLTETDTTTPKLGRSMRTFGLGGHNGGGAAFWKFTDSELCDKYLKALLRYFSYCFKEAEEYAVGDTRGLENVKVAELAYSRHTPTYRSIMDEKYRSLADKDKQPLIHERIFGLALSYSDILWNYGNTRHGAAFFEALIDFSSVFLKAVFDRKAWEFIEKECGHLLRSPAFNPMAHQTINISKANERELGSVAALLRKEREKQSRQQEAKTTIQGSLQTRSPLLAYLLPAPSTKMKSMLDRYQPHRRRKLREVRKKELEQIAAEKDRMRRIALDAQEDLLRRKAEDENGDDDDDSETTDDDDEEVHTEPADTPHAKGPADAVDTGEEAAIEGNL